jgi:hypothetical protein
VHSVVGNIDDGQRHTRGRERLRYLLPDAARGTGHYRHSSGQFHPVIFVRQGGGEATSL